MPKPPPLSFRRWKPHQLLLKQLLLRLSQLSKPLLLLSPLRSKRLPHLWLPMSKPFRLRLPRLLKRPPPL